MKWLIIALGIVLLAWTACVHINISDGDIDDSNTVTGIEIEEEQDANNED